MSERLGDDGWRDAGDGLRRASVELQAAEQAAQGLSRAVGAGLRGAFDDATWRSARFSAVLRGLAEDISRGALRAAVAPVGDAVGRGVADAVAGVAAGLLGAGAPQAFAKGGVVDGATAFALGGGAGVAGEAGPEAILPLTRGADGRLGVSGGVNVTINVTTPDVAGFERSRGQIAAALARAVERGRGRA
jgi:lambda family phage tail tape measure protein